MSDVGTKAAELDVELVIELGSVRMSVDQLLNLQEGSLIELGRPLGELRSVKMNGTEIGKGEVVVVEENFGVRMIEEGEAD